METIYIYNENCAMAGRAVPMRELERYDNPDDGNDWSSYLLDEETARIMESRGSFGRQVARTLRGML